MLDLIYQIGRGFAFGGVRHPDLTGALRWTPLVFAVLGIAVYVALPVKPALVGDGSLSRHLIAVFSTLPGFFIAALAAVATFSRPEMDETMPDPAPQLKLKTGNERDWVDLTFRMFLSHLFGYLTTLAFIAVFLFLSVDLLSASGNDLLAKAVNEAALSHAALALNAAYVGLAVWLSAKVVITTLLGIYFLAERIHRPHA
ncbi:hypothetical protein [Brevundimonas vesicularis]|uniref:hypothetical protein n=1 Tax=Brevundimonas vesicularis TaxID=41276 RepID=UPI00384DD363